MIQPEISEAVSRLYMNIGWVFGPGANGSGHSFTLTPEGDATKRILVDYWFSKKPELPGWTFDTSRQAKGRTKDFSIQFGETEVSTASLWITPTINLEIKKVDIKAWSPTFAELDEDRACTILFIQLDDALGEEGPNWCPGFIEMKDSDLSGSLPILELREYIDETFANHESSQAKGWESVYKQEPVNGDIPRGDIFVGSTESMNLILGFNRDYCPNEDPSKKSELSLSLSNCPPQFSLNSTRL